jgi:ureidoacrylate peracid hydrolase
MKNSQDIAKRSFVRFKLPGDIPEVTLNRDETALLVIDMQRMNAHRDGKYGAWARSAGIAEQLEYYFSTLETTTVPRIKNLIASCREFDVEVVYTRVAAVTDDGREMGWRYKAWNMTDRVDSKDAQILPELAPKPNDLVVTKTCTSAFLGSHLDRYLHNMGIRKLIACGVATNGCVESAVRDASDLEYSIVLATDACATISREDHDLSIKAMHPLYAEALSTDQVIDKLRRDCGRGQKARA